jgi:hypothetical protein
MVFLLALVMTERAISSQLENEVFITVKTEFYFFAAPIHKRRQLFPIFRGKLIFSLENGP